jgi:(2R)-3-sulfolactate dehydrogenase (NADP+)
VYGHASPKLEEMHRGSAVVDASHGFVYPALDLAIDWLAQAAPIQGPL